MSPQRILKTVTSYHLAWHITFSSPEYLVCTSVNILPIKKERQQSSSSTTAQQSTPPTSQSLILDAPSVDEVEDITLITEAKATKRRRSTAEVEEGDSKRRSLPKTICTYHRLSKRVRAHEESETNVGNLRTEEFIHSINELLSPFDMQFGDYTSMEFFVRSNSETSGRALDVWKNFLWEWTTERALPFETTYKHKYFPFGRC